MFDNPVLDRETGLHIRSGDDATRPAESPEEEHSRLVREWTEKLSSMPGRHGRLLRRFLASGWC